MSFIKSQVFFQKTKIFVQLIHINYVLATKKDYNILIIKKEVFSMNGREICKEMKKIREKLAKENGIDGFEYKECTFEGECKGHCPACDAETKELNRLLNEINIDKPKITKELDSRSNILMGSISIERPKMEPILPKDQDILAGKIVQPKIPKEQKNEETLMGELVVDPNYDEDPFDRDRPYESIWSRKQGKVRTRPLDKEIYEDKNHNKKGILNNLNRKKK